MLVIQRICLLIHSESARNSTPASSQSVPLNSHLEKTMRFWLQYHSYDNLGYLPSGYETDVKDISTLDTSNFELSCVTTSKPAIRNAIGDIVFLIVGYGKNPKSYVLWSWFFIDEVEERPGEGFDAFGEGKVLNSLPLLTGKEFDEFKKQMANFSLGFINISNRPYTQYLIELAKDRGGLKL